MNLLLEQCVIGAILSGDEKALPAMLRLGLSADCFEDVRCRDIFVRAVELSKNGELPHRATLGMDAPGQVDPLFMAECVELSPGSYSVIQRVPDLVDGLKRRRLTALALDLQRDMEAGDPGEALAMFTRDAAAVHQIGRSHQPALADVAGDLLNRWRDPPPASAIRWPLAVMDTWLGSLSDEYVIVASQPSVGKTALALQFSVAVARAGSRVAFASLESSVERIIPRLVAHLGQVDILRLRHRRAGEADHAAAGQAVEALRSLPLSIRDTPATIGDLALWAQDEVRRGAGVIIIDNLRHIRPDRDFKNRFDLFAHHSLELKYLRDYLRVPVVALHHLNSDDKLSWSSDIERDGDIVMILERDAANSIEPCRENHFHGRDFVNLRVAKNRDGKTGTIPLEFIKPFQTFEEVTR